jgi:hypothetical protein
MNKKGLSGLIITFLIIVFSVVFIFALGIIINNFVKIQSSEIYVSKYVVDIKIKSASLNYLNSTATVRVKRDLGAGDLIGIKFIF